MSCPTALVDGAHVPAPCRIVQGTPLPSRPRGDRRPTQIIVHESVTSSTEATVRVLQGRGLGVHFMVAPDGSVTQHGDPVTDRMAHAGSQNGTSFAIEVVNPYYAARDRPGPPWELVIEGRWVHRGRYLVPTPAQLEAAAQLIRWATDPEGPVRVPRVWPGLRGSRLALSRLRYVWGGEAPDVRSPGVWAHTYTAHADAAVPVLYAWLRLEAGLSAEAAYAECVHLATTRWRWADVWAWVAPPAA